MRRGGWWDFFEERVGHWASLAFLRSGGKQGVRFARMNSVLTARTLYSELLVLRPSLGRLSRRCFSYVAPRVDLRWFSKWFVYIFMLFLLRSIELKCICTERDLVTRVIDTVAK